MDVPTPVLKNRTPLLGSIAAGWPSPAEEELVDALSLDDYLLPRPDQSYLVRVGSDAMSGAGIRPGDLVIVERGRKPQDGDIVIAQADGEWMMRFYVRRAGRAALESAGEKSAPVFPRELAVRGVVTAVVRKYK